MQFGKKWLQEGFKQASKQKRNHTINDRKYQQREKPHTLTSSRSSFFTYRAARQPQMTFPAQYRPEGWESWVQIYVPPSAASP